MLRSLVLVVLVYVGLLTALAVAFLAVVVLERVWPRLRDRQHGAEPARDGDEERTPPNGYPTVNV